MELGHCGLFVNMFLAVVVNLLVLGFSFGEVLGHCGGHSSSSSGTIQSPNYPNTYTAGEECIWTVAIDGSVENIRLSFSSFDLQPKSADGNCVDYVAIFRLQLNKDPGAVLEGRFCGDSIPQSIKIEESSMTVQFISDSVANPHTGFSLHFEANFEDTSVSQATAGIVAAIFCAVVFIGVGMLRCMMMGACNACGGPNPADQNRDRHVVAASDSYQYRADFPPSYSTVMDHPERYPTPEASPAVTQNRDRTRTDGSHTVSQTQLQGRPVFTLQSSGNNSSDEDDSDTPPPPYPGLVTSDDVNVDVATDNSNNTTDNQPDTGSHNVGVVIDDEQSNEPPVSSSCDVPSSEVEDAQNPSTAGAHQAPSDLSTVAESSPQERDNSWNRGDVELSQTDVPHDDETEMVFMI